MSSRELDASVIIPSHRGAHRLPELLDALAEQTYTGAWEALVVLDGVFDDSPAIIASYADRVPVRVLRLEDPQGVSRALNAAYADARGRVLIRCDDDLTPGPEMVSRHVAGHRGAEDVGLIGPTRDVFPPTPYARVYGEQGNTRLLAAAYARSADHRWVSWAAHNSITRDTWDRVGGFDPSFVYGQDSELGFRLHEAGIRMVVDPALEIAHRGPATTAANRVPRAFVSGASRRHFSTVHPGASHAAPTPAGRMTVSDRVWTSATSLIARSVRTREGYARLGLWVDRSIAVMPSNVARRLVALSVESAGASGVLHGPADLSQFKVQKVSELAGERPTTQDARRVAVVSNVLPHQGVPHAGGQYMLHLNDAWDAMGVDYVYLVPDYPTNRAASHEQGAPPHVLLGAPTTPAQRVLRKTTDLVRRIDPGLPDWAVARALLQEPARGHLARAECIDLQWMESIRLAPVVRRINPRARLVGTFHDVLSQRFGRAAAESASPRSVAKWRTASWLERRAQRHAVRRLDTSVVFADKDADLIGRPRNAKVIVPPMASGPVLPHAPTNPPTVVFVAFLRRRENLDAVEWLLQEIWPTVRAANPEALLRIIGGGPVDELRERYSDQVGVTFTGYVADLAPEYAAATVCVVPLKLGAGVKFKVIEAMAAGVPVVSTTVGAEGIGTAANYASLTDDPHQIAAGLIGALADPGRAHSQASDTASWARDNFGVPRFFESVRETYDS